MTAGTVCVVGGSFAGLLAARVLAAHARRVVILERDALPVGPAGHLSVPQGRHGHFLQPEALAKLEDWFPGFTDDATARGAVLAPPGHHRMFRDGEPMPDLDITLLMASRPFLEARIRSRVAAIPHVEFRHARAAGFRYRDKAVAGVVYRIPDTGWAATEHVVDADLTVDATGRGSSLGRWLEQDGFPAPLLQRVPVGIGYTTALFRRDEPRPRISCALDQLTPGADGRGLVAVAVYAIEGNLWQVVGIAYGRDPEEATAADLREVCAGLPEVFREATAGEPVCAAERFYYTDSRRRRIADLERFPAGLISIGDAVATYNPRHGIGMAAAVKQAALLADFGAGRSKDFLRAREAVVDEAWTASAR